jgi:predicted RNA binding protein YcfA (HicA-like mRNA interferase family)
VNETHPVTKIRRYRVHGQDCILASVAADVLGVHRKTVTRRQAIRGPYQRLVDPETGRVMVPLHDIKPDLSPGMWQYIEREAEDA